MTLKRTLKVLRSDIDNDRFARAIRVAFASTDLKQVNQHFGAAQSFAIYGIDMERIELIEVMEFGDLALDDNEDKLGEKIAALEGCIAVYTQAVGASAVNQLKEHGIQPIKVSPGASVTELLESLQEQLRLGPCAWLARAIQSQTPVAPGMTPPGFDRFGDMESDGWEE